MTNHLQQWAANIERAREQAPEGAICLFHVGDFYEAYGPDALTIRDELGLRMQSLGDIPMVGWPTAQCTGPDANVGQLIAAGYRVAILEQVAEPKKEIEKCANAIDDSCVESCTVDDGYLF